jgi:hypothetical protein
MKAKPYISRWTALGPREAVPCLAAGQIDDLGKGAIGWLPFSFFVAPDGRARAELRRPVMSRR